MRNYVFIITYFMLLVFFTLADATLYYRGVNGHSIVPFIICLIITIAAALLGMTATYQTYRHRHDSEPW